MKNRQREIVYFLLFLLLSSVWIRPITWFQRPCLFFPEYIIHKWKTDLRIDSWIKGESDRIQATTGEKIERSRHENVHF
jgi:hypothetical protein